MSDTLRGLTELDRTIHEPARLLIVSLLYLSKEADFLWLLNQTELTKGNLSTHLGKLEQAGYLEVKKQFRGKVPWTLYRLTDQGRQEFERYRKAMRAALR
ncbi:MAG: transcriptional regulator [Bryobacterales bacterium]|nr:transcriptional regulator [Bryobacterales bacterium]